MDKSSEDGVETVCPPSVSTASEPPSEIASTGACSARQKSLRFQTIFHQTLGPIGTTAVNALRQVELARNAIASACARQPQHAWLLKDALSILCWTVPLPVTDRVYVAHVSELIQRVINRQSVSEGTRAEVLACLCGASLHRPLNQQAAALMARLMSELFGYELNFEDNKKATEPWPGACDQLLQDSCRRLYVADRIYPNEERVK